MRGLASWSWPSGLPGSPAACWCGETGKRGDLSHHWTKVLAGSNPVTSTLAYLLTRQTLLPMFSIVRGHRVASFATCESRGARALRLSCFRALKRRLGEGVSP